MGSAIYCKRLFLRCFVVLIIILPAVNAMDITHSGTCGMFDIEIDSSTCEDVKLDFSGHVYDDGWKSSYFYVSDGTCRTIRIETEESGDFDIRVKLRNGTSEIYTIKQQCPEASDTLVTAGLAAAALLIAAVFYGKSRG